MAHGKFNFDFLGEAIDRMSWPERVVWLFVTLGGVTVISVGPYQVEVSPPAKVILAAVFLLILLASAYFRLLYLDRAGQSARDHSHVSSLLDDTTLPGFAATIGLEIRNVAAVRRQFFFDHQTPEGARASFYLSATDTFIFSVTDTHGEVVTLEMPIGNGGVPIYKFIFLTCQIGVTHNASYLQVLVDAKTIQGRSLARRLDLGSRNWMNKGTIGADTSGLNNAAFQVAMFAAGHVTLTKTQIVGMTDAFRTYLKAIAEKGT